MKSITKRVLISKEQHKNVTTCCDIIILNTTYNNISPKHNTKLNTISITNNKIWTSIPTTCCPKETVYLSSAICSLHII